MAEAKEGRDIVKTISFAWTTPAILARRKTCTRRQWGYEYARRWHEGDLAAAYDRQPRYRGKQIETIILTCDPYLETTDLMPDSDYEAEGFAYLEEQGMLFRGIEPRAYWEQWKAAKMPMWVVRFEYAT